jgi:hypothetical protein
MKCLDTDAENPEAVGAGALRLDALVVYEDFATGLRAKHALDHAVQLLESAADVQVNLWRFDLLGEPGLRQRAAQEAAGADLVFLSAHGQSGLPRTVNQWFQDCFARRGSEPCALAVSLDAGAKDTPSVSRLLEVLGAAARLAGVDMFVQFGEPQEELESAIEGIRQCAETTTMILEEFLHRAGGHSFRDWGINE